MNVRFARAAGALAVASTLAACSGAEDFAETPEAAAPIAAGEAELFGTPSARWQQRFDGTNPSYSDDYASRLLRTPDGKLLAFGSLAAPSAGGASRGVVVVAKLEPSTGAILWRRDVPVAAVDGDSLALVRGAAIDRSGNAYVASLGGQVTSVAPNGAVRWTVQAAAIADQLVLMGSDVVVGTRKGLEVHTQGTGSLRATWRVPGGSVSCLAVNARGNLVAGGAQSTERGDVPWLASFGTAGQPRWTSNFGVAAGAGCRSIAADGAGNVLIAASAAGSVAVSDAVFAAVDDAGALRWSRTIPGTSTEFRNAFAVTPDGSGGAYGAYVGVSGATGWFTSPSTRTVVRLDATGKQLWAKAKGGSFDSSANVAVAHELALDPRGNVVVATEGVVSKYAPTGALVNEVTVAKGSGNSFVWAGAGETFVSATVSGSAKAGTDVLVSRYAF